jgi:hypothetical protein
MPNLCIIANLPFLTWVVSAPWKITNSMGWPPEPLPDRFDRQHRALTIAATSAMRAAMLALQL